MQGIQERSRALPSDTDDVLSSFFSFDYFPLRLRGTKQTHFPCFCHKVNFSFFCCAAIEQWFYHIFFNKPYSSLRKDIAIECTQHAHPSQETRFISFGYFVWVNQLKILCPLVSQFIFCHFSPLKKHLFSSKRKKKSRKLYEANVICFVNNSYIERNPVYFFMICD